MPEKKIKPTEEKVYNLSEASKKTRDEYGEANKLTSLIYTRFKQVMNLYWNRAQLQKLRTLVLRVIRSAPKEHTGNRKMWDGNLKLLAGFQLNHKGTAGNLFRKTIKLEVEPGGTMKITIPPFKYQQAFERAYPKTSIAQVKLYVFSFDILHKTSTGKSIILLNQPRGKDLTEESNFELLLEDNRLSLIICKVSFKSEPDDSAVNDRQYIGATLLKAIYIRDGEEVHFVPEEEEKPVRKTEALPGEWEDLG